MDPNSFGMCAQFWRKISKSYLKYWMELKLLFSISGKANKMGREILSYYLLGLLWRQSRWVLMLRWERKLLIWCCKLCPGTCRGCFGRVRWFSWPNRARTSSKLSPTWNNQTLHCKRSSGRNWPVFLALHRSNILLTIRLCKFCRNKVL